MQGSSTYWIGLRLRQKRERGHQESEFTPSEVTHQSVGEQIKLATEPILKQVKNFQLSAERNHLSSAGNNEVTGFRQDEMLASSSDNGTTDGKSIYIN